MVTVNRFEGKNGFPLFIKVSGGLFGVGDCYFEEKMRPAGRGTLCMGARVSPQRVARRGGDFQAGEVLPGKIRETYAGGCQISTSM